MTAQLKTFLKDLPPGPIADEHRSKVIGLLSDCWSELDGSEETKMAAYKLSRAESLIWEPPLLTFIIERHGATVGGSSRAELQHWEVNVNAGTASRGHSKRRQLYRMGPRLNVQPIVQSVIDALRSGESLANGALIRDTDDQLRIKHGILIPGDGPKETVAGRRRRFRDAMERAMRAIGWELVVTNPVLKFKKSVGKSEAAS
jgi:hypothetical protein